MRIVVSNRRAGKFREAEKKAARASVANVANQATSARRMELVEDRDPEDDLARRTMIFEGSQAQLEDLVRDAPPDVIVEPLIEHYPVNARLGLVRGASFASSSSTFPTGTGQTVEYKVRGGGAALEHATVKLFFRDILGRIHEVDRITDAGGAASFDFSSFFQPVFVIVSPYADFWPLQDVFRGNATFNCPPLPSNRRINWWHRETGLNSFDQNAGSGIRIGVIDSGFGPHPDLHGTDVGAFINNTFNANGGADVGSHGTHVSGTISSNPGGARRHAGVAPGVDLFSARVFPEGENAGATNADIANAIDFLSRDHQCDLINMSLGAPVGSNVIEDAVQDALERGTLCICAAGNSSGPVEFPGAFSQTVAVAAAGQVGRAPTGSVSADTLPDDPSLFGRDQLYAANFTCFGPEVDAIAPGVGIVAPVPSRHGLDSPYAAFDGTSMATPIACGTLARVLAKDTSYQALPRDLTRSQTARAIMSNIARQIGLPTSHEGHGLTKD